jgi:fructose-1,6-bisphosphatase II
MGNMKENLFQKEALIGLRNVTEETSRLVFPLFGKNDKDKADHLAVEAMRSGLRALPFGTRVILGEGEKDEAPMLYEGERLGGGEAVLDLVVDPLECTTNFAKGLPNSLCVIAYAETNQLISVPGTYMEQWIAGPRFQGGFEPHEPLSKNIEKLADSLNKTHSELLVVVQDRPRHEKLIQGLRDLGVGVSLIDSGSVTAALDICLDRGHYDAMIGTFGAPEGLIASIIARCTGSEMKGILRPHKEIYKERWTGSGYADGQVLDKKEFVRSDFCGFIGSILSTNIIGKGITSVHGIMNGSSIVITNLGTEIHPWEINVNGT